MEDQRLIFGKKSIMTLQLLLFLVLALVALFPLWDAPQP
jgi:hypothetical protein